MSIETIFAWGVRRAQQVQPQRALFRLVVDELPLPGEQPLVFQTLDGLPRSETQIAGKNVHSVGSLNLSNAAAF
ncbi:hypothetical protein ACVW0I_007282 [Bradyrhizobium sp. LM6.11]